MATKKIVIRKRVGAPAIPLRAESEDIPDGNPIRKPSPLKKAPKPPEPGEAAASQSTLSMQTPSPEPKAPSMQPDSPPPGDIQVEKVDSASSAETPAAKPEGEITIDGQPLENAMPQIKLNPYIEQHNPSHVLEAALFMSSGAIATPELAKLVGIAAVGHVSELMKKLAVDYEQRNSSLEIAEENGKWTMRVKAKLAPAVRQFAGESEISRHALRTLAYISRNNGITKRDLFNKLGSTIYEDVAELSEKGFLAASPSGRTKSLKVTPKFKQYFEGQ